METFIILLVLGMLLRFSREEDAIPITPTSVLKLVKTGTRWALNSHLITYGSGSGGQSVTLATDPDSDNANFVVMTTNVSRLGHPIMCGDTVYLQHTSTGKYLSINKDFRSPFNSGLEAVMIEIDRTRKVPHQLIFEVQCEYRGEEEAKNEIWTTETNVAFLHQDSNSYLASSNRQFGQPINGQREVFGAPHISQEANWQVWGGFLMEESVE